MVRFGRNTLNVLQSNFQQLSLNERPRMLTEVILKKLKGFKNISTKKTAKTESNGEIK